MENLVRRIALASFSILVLLPASFAAEGPILASSAQPIGFHLTGPDEPNGPLTRERASKSGRYLAFISTASNLVPGVGGTAEVYRLDRKTGKVSCPTRNPGGIAGNDVSIDIEISNNGRYVTYISYATNLGVPANGNGQAIWQDMKTGKRVLCSRTALGAPGNADSNEARISGNGKYVAFDTDATNLVNTFGNTHRQVYVCEIATGVVTPVSIAHGGAFGNSDSYLCDVSNDGKSITFVSYATNLDASAAKSPLVGDIFVRDLKHDMTIMVSRGHVGAVPNASSFEAQISANGRYVAYLSDASNLVASDPNGARTDAFFFDLKLGTIERIAGIDEGSNHFDLSETSLSADGRYFVCRATIDHPTVAGTFLSDVRRFDRVTGEGCVIHVNDNDNATKWDNMIDPRITRDGKSLIFQTSAKVLDAPPLGSLFDLDLSN